MGSRWWRLERRIGSQGLGDFGSYVQNPVKEPLLWGNQALSKTQSLSSGTSWSAGGRTRSLWEVGVGECAWSILMWIVDTWVLFSDSRRESGELVCWLTGL